MLPDSPKANVKKKGFQTRFHGENVIVIQLWTEQGEFWFFFPMTPCQYGIEDKAPEGALDSKLSALGGD